MPKWSSKHSKPDVSTVDVPLGAAHVSQLTGAVFTSSDLGYVDTPTPYSPDWAAVAERWDQCSLPSTTYSSSWGGN